jgi:hypothetical protein
MKITGALEGRQPALLLAAGATIVLATAVAGLFLGKALLGAQQATKSDLDLSGPVTRAMSGWESLRALKTHFPADHAALVKSLTDDVVGGVPADAAMLKAFQSIDVVRRREERHFGMARAETLRQSLRAELRLLTYLEAAHGGRACSTLAVEGLSSTLALLGPAASQDKALWQQADALVATYLETVAEGLRERRAHPQLTEQQWQAYAVHLLSQGVSEADLAAFADPEKSSADPATCRIFIKIIDLTSAPGDPATQPIIPFIAQSIAATL